MNLITGHTGTSHVYAVDDAAVHRLLVGDGDYILPYGNRFAITKTDAHTVSISDGYLMMQGRLACIRPGNSESINFTNGAEGYYTLHVIAVQYSQDANGIESVKLVDVPGGRSTTSDITDPTLITGDINDGETHQFGIWRVVMNGLLIETMERMADPLTVNPIQDIYNDINAMETRVDTAISTLNERANETLSNVEETAQNAISGWENFYYDRGSSFSLGTGVPCAGYMTSSGKTLYFTIPTRPIIDGSITVNTLRMIIRLSTGGYPYVQSGTKYTQLNSDDKLVYSGGAIKISGISAVTASRVNGGIRVQVDFSTSLKRPDKKTSVLNNTPVSVYVGGESAFTVV